MQVSKTLWLAVTLSLIVFRVSCFLKSTHQNAPLKSITALPAAVPRRARCAAVRIPCLGACARLG